MLHQAMERIIKIRIVWSKFLKPNTCRKSKSNRRSLRNIKYSNESNISNLVSGFRDIKIEFEYETLNSENPFNTATVFVLLSIKVFQKCL